MTVELLRDFLGWSTIINMALLLFWVIWMMLAREFVYRVHGRWFPLSTEKLDATHYAGMLFFKLCIFLFNIVPYLALRIVA